MTLAERKKCVIIGPAFPLRGGIAQLNESLAEEYAKQGIDSVIFSFSLQYPEFLFPGKTQTEANDRKAPEGIDIRSTINSIGPLSWWKTAKLIAQEEPDFIVVRFWIPFMGPALGTILRWLKKYWNVPVLGLLDNVIPHERRPGDRLFTRYFLRACDSYVVMSSSVLKELDLFDRKKPRKLLYHPLYDHFGEEVERPLARRHLSLRPDQRVILFFGIIRKYKGLKLLLKAVSKMQQRDRLTLVIAGEFYEDRAKYERLIDRYGIRDHVSVHDGFVDKFKVRYYFSAADIVAQPYLSATQSGVTQIAYHFNRPMLVTDVGGLPEIVPNGKVGYVCSPDAQEIANALDRFFQEDRFDEFSANVVEEKKRFGWDVFAQAIMEQALSSH